MELATRITYFLLRVVSGLLIFQSGAMKVLGWYGGVPGGQPAFLTQVGIGGWIEFLGGLLVMIGLFTRPAAFILSGTMAVAYWQFHAPSGGWPLQNQGVPAVTLCFIFLYIAAAGAGPWSVDALIKQRKTGAVTATTS